MTGQNLFLKNWTLIINKENVSRNSPSSLFGAFFWSLCFLCRNKHEFISKAVWYTSIEICQNQVVYSILWVKINKGRQLLLILKSHTLFGVDNVTDCPFFIWNKKGPHNCRFARSKLVIDPLIMYKLVFPSIFLLSKLINDSQ